MNKVVFDRTITLFDGFSGTERLASAIGNGGLADVGQPIVEGDVLADKGRERDTVLFRVMAPYPLRINRNRLDTLYSLTRPDTTTELTYFFHPDHLGSASWITDLSGQPVQHLQYKPFGGDYIDQQDPNTDYSERFRFTGKERDAETGYDYFGARYYSSSLGIWLSVDPMSDKYPSLSPYVYCADNPMRLVDPYGDTIVIEGKDGAKIKYKAGMDSENMTEFAKKAIDVLNNGYSGSETAKRMINELSESKYEYKVVSSKKSNYITDDNLATIQNYGDPNVFWEEGGGTILWNTEGSKVYEQNPGYNTSVLKARPDMGLFHELGHAWDHMAGVLGTDESIYKGLKISEWMATRTENMIRKEMGIPLRTYYEKGRILKDNSYSISGYRLINSKGKHRYTKYQH